MKNFDYIKKMALDKFTVDDFLNETYRGELIGQQMCELICKEKGSNCKGTPCETYCSEWLHKEYKKSILDTKEREYLSAVIKPFRDKVDFIKKCKSIIDGREYIEIFLFDEDNANLPDFSEGTMYKGMEAGKEYTLKELGL